MAERLRTAREAAGYSSARSAAIANGWKPSTYAAHENGQNGFSAKAAQKYGKAYRVSAGWLLIGEGSGPPLRHPQMRAVKVVGYVQAGAWAEAHELPSDEQYPVQVPNDTLRLGSGRVFALEVRGTSMDRVYPEGTVVVCAEFGPHHELNAGKRYVIERERADGLREVTIKTVSADTDGRYWLVPESNDPRFSQALPVEGDEGDTIRVLGRVCYSVRPE